MAKLVKPSQMTMQSQPGRFCDEKYRNLKLQEQQFTAHSESLAPSLPEFYNKIERKPQPSVLEQLTGKLTVKETSKPRFKKTWAFSTQSRNDYYRAIGNKDRIPSTGYYKPKYDSVFKAAPTPVIPPAHARRPTPVKTSRPSEETEHEALKPALNMVPFQLQLSRPDITRMAPDVNEKRFHSVEVTPVYSNIRRVRTVDMSKTLNRPDYIDAKPHPKYDPKYELIKKKVVPDIYFGKVSPRVDRLPPTSSRLDYSNIRFSQTMPRTAASQFSALASRPVSDTFPTHMVKVNTRMSLTVLQASSLAMSGGQSRTSLTDRHSKDFDRQTSSDRRSPV